MSVEARAREDKELMARVSAGSVEAFEKLYDRYCNRAYRLALSVCREDGRAQGAVQDAFLSIWRSRSSYRKQRGTVAAWVLTVVRNRATDLERAHHNHASPLGDEERLNSVPAPDDPSEHVTKRAEAQQLRAALARLPDAQQEVIALAYYGQLTHTEIATQLGLPAGTVKGRMRLGLHKLKASLDRATA